MKARTPKNRSVRSALVEAQGGRICAEDRPEGTGRVVVDGREETRDVIVLPGRVRNWWRRNGHALVLEDLDEVLGELPAHLVIGTGADGRMQADAGAVGKLQAQGVEVEVLPTEDAVRRYGELNPAANGRRPPPHLLGTSAGATGRPPGRPGPRLAP